MNNKLSDPDFLFSILTAIVKKSGGNIMITEKELGNISKGDYLGMYYDPKILKGRLTITDAKNIY